MSSEAEFITIYGAICLKRRLTGGSGGHVAQLWLSYLVIAVVFFPLTCIYTYRLLEIPDVLRCKSQVLTVALCA